MTFQTNTNESRARKMVEIIGHLQTSARANRATAEEIDALLAPVLEAMRDLGATIGQPRRVAPPDTPVGKHPKGTTRSWADAVEFARTAPLRDVAAAMQVFSTRLEEAIEDMEIQS